MRLHTGILQGVQGNYQVLTVVSSAQAVYRIVIQISIWYVPCKYTVIIQDVTVPYSVHTSVSAVQLLYTNPCK